MAESAEQVYARVREAAPADGRLPVPSLAEWDVFPWDVAEGRLATKPLPSPAPEEPREGENGVECALCGNDESRVIWRNDRWRLKHPNERSGLPLVLSLQPIEHLDLTDLDDAMAAEYGVLCVRLARVIEGLPNIARCHVMRIGDGAEHLHVWLMARTEGLLATRGSFAVDWDDILPPGPEDAWRADLASVASALAQFDG